MYQPFFDRLLDRGWFRACTDMFTTHFLVFNNTIYDVVWLRIDLQNFASSGTSKKIIKKAGRFSFAVSSYQPSAALDELYDLYRDSINFEPSASLEHLLGPQSGSFKTMMICIYDEEKLIGAGIFDMGENAAAGISSFFHPQYKKYSIGKLLVQYKLQYCKEQGIKWFYPGYFVPGYNRFDYKLEMSVTGNYWFDALSGEWQTMEKFTRERSILMQKINGLSFMKEALDMQGMKTHLILYRYFDAALWFNDAEHLIYEPVFIYFDKVKHDGQYIIMTYNLEINDVEMVVVLPLVTEDIAELPDEKILANNILIVKDKHSVLFPEN